MGTGRFNDLLEMNPRISGKVLSDQLKNLERCGYIKKVVVSKMPLRAECRLTELGPSLNRVLYEMMTFTRDKLLTGSEVEDLREDGLKEVLLIDDEEGS